MPIEVLESPEALTYGQAQERVTQLASRYERTATLAYYPPTTSWAIHFEPRAEEVTTDTDWQEYRTPAVSCVSHTLGQVDWHNLAFALTPQACGCGTHAIQVAGNPYTYAQFHAQPFFTGGQPQGIAYDPLPNSYDYAKAVC